MLVLALCLVFYVLPFFGVMNDNDDVFIISVIVATLQMFCHLYFALHGLELDSGNAFDFQNAGSGSRITGSKTFGSDRIRFQ